MYITKRKKYEIINMSEKYMGTRYMVKGQSPKTDHLTKWKASLKCNGFTDMEPQKRLVMTKIFARPLYRDL